MENQIELFMLEAIVSHLVRKLRKSKLGSNVSQYSYQ